MDALGAFGVAAVDGPGVGALLGARRRFDARGVLGGCASAGPGDADLWHCGARDWERPRPWPLTLHPVLAWWHDQQARPLLTRHALFALEHQEQRASSGVGTNPSAEGDQSSVWVNEVAGAPSSLSTVAVDFTDFDHLRDLA